MIVDNKTEYRVEGYFNRWSIINSYKNYHLLENCTYGDETCYLVVDEKFLNVNRKYQKYDTKDIITIPTFMDVICETYDGLLTALFDEDLISEKEYEKEREI